MATRIPSTASRKPKAVQTVEVERRAPRQERAKSTIETILEATARILERQGPAKLNTNSIAEHAGISIGTLYQYFRNKNEILVAIGLRLFEADTAAALNALAAVRADDSQPERLVIRALIDAYKVRRKTRRAAIDAIISEGFSNRRTGPVAAIADAVLARGGLTPAGVFVITRAVNGVLRATTEEDSPFLATREFEDELVRLVRNFLAVPV